MIDMDQIINYPRNDYSEMYAMFPDLNDDDNDNDNDDHRYLLDMDSKQSVLTARGCELARKRCSIGDENNECDGTGWSDKPIKNWCQDETISWLIFAASLLGQSYSSIQHSLAVPGYVLVNLTRDDFIYYDPEFGDQLYDLLHPQRYSDILPSLNGIHSNAEDQNSQSNSTHSSDTESESSTDTSPIKRPPGRPRLTKPGKPSASQGKLWEFIRDLLHNPETCPSLICWEDYSQGKFRFVKSDDIAKKWGSRKGNTKMTYEKFSRAMRYYYRGQIFLPVPGRRLVYQFGPNAKGWQTDNPNFRY